VSRCQNVPVRCAHALDTSADANLDHTRLDLICDVDTSLKAGGALAVEGADGGSLGHTSNKGSGAHLSGATAGSQDLAYTDILDEGRVDLGAVEQALEGASHEIGGVSVLEGALAAFGEGGAEAGGDNDIVGVLLKQLVAAGLGAGQLAGDLRQTVES
jgi:hypothetical protein